MPKESGLPTAQVAAEFGLQPEAFRSYLKEHEPELYARKGMVRTDTGGAVSRRSMEKYSEAMHLYGTTTESVKNERTASLITWMKNSKNCLVLYGSV